MKDQADRGEPAYRPDRSGPSTGRTVKRRDAADHFKRRPRPAYQIVPDRPLFFWAGITRLLPGASRTASWIGEDMLDRLAELGNQGVRT